ncbi:MAG: Gfo/Idh/MocA family oxidoreductase [Bacteroidota bacterium]
MIRIGLLGAGHLGKIHLKLLQEIEAFTVVGFYDVDPKVQTAISESLGLKAFSSAEQLLDQVDAVDIVTPTLSHFTYANMALRQGKHIFIEKPLTQTVTEAEQLLALSGQHPDLVIQIGHVERFNPAFQAVSSQPIQPMFIEGHRLAMYNPRGTDVSVVLDLMIHDLDVVLSMVPSPVRHISASGVAVISDTPDIANARIEFENGCIANLTASRISLKNMRRLRMFQKNTYLAVDFLNKKLEVFRLSEEKESHSGTTSFAFETGEQTKYLVFEQPEIQQTNAIKQELEEFASSILHDSAIRVSLKDGYRALKMAHEILQNIQERIRSATIG